MTRCKVSVKTFVHNVKKSKCSKKLKGVGWAGVRSVFSTQLLSFTPLQKGRPTYCNFLITFKSFVSEKEPNSVDDKN